MIRRVSLAAVAAASAMLLLPALPGTGDAHAQMTMNLASASRRSPGVNMIVEEYSHGVSVPEGTTGRTRGQREHEPFTIRKRIDAATPLLYQALARSETIPTVTLRIPMSRAAQGPTMTITLTAARIIAIEASASGNALPTEEVSFNYEKIKWESSEGGTSFEDNWRENN